MIDEAEIANPAETVPTPRRRRAKTRYVYVKGPGPAYCLRPAGYTLIQRMTEGGRSMGSIAKALGVSPRAFQQLRKRDPALVDAIELGHGALGDELTDILLTMAREGQVAAAIWLEKTRLGLTEKGPAGAATAVQISINLPSALERGEYLKLVTGQEVDNDI